MNPVDQAIRDIHRCRGEIATVAIHAPAPALGTWPIEIAFYFQHYRFTAVAGDGEKAFDYDPETLTICFDATSMARVREVAERFSDEIGDIVGSASRQRRAEVAVNMYIVHELTHIVQDLPDYDLVPLVKAGLGPESLGALDAAADYNAAWICAVMEAKFAGLPVSTLFPGMLLLAYLIGARGFPPGDRDYKKQRFMGLLLGGAINHADSEGKLVRERLSRSWSPATPIYSFNLARTPTLNAFVNQPAAGLLFKGNTAISKKQAATLWSEIGPAPVTDLLPLVFSTLIDVGIVERRALRANQSALGA